MVTAGLKNPPLKYVEMFTKNAYEKPKHKETLRVFGLVSSCGQLIVEPHPIKTKSIEQTDSTTDEMKMVTILCHCTMIKAGFFCWSFVLFTKRSACPESVQRKKWSGGRRFCRILFLHYDWPRACQSCPNGPSEDFRRSSEEFEDLPGTFLSWREMEKIKQAESDELLIKFYNFNNWSNLRDVQL